jgi:hypothetical protein
MALCSLFNLEILARIPELCESHPQKVPGTGFEPAQGLVTSDSSRKSKKSQHLRGTRKGTGDLKNKESRATVAHSPELARVVTAWGKIPAPLQTAILAIVASVDGHGEGKP